MSDDRPPNAPLVKRRRRLAPVLAALLLVAVGALLAPRWQRRQLEQASLGTLSSWAAREPKRAEVQFYLGRRELASGNAEGAVRALKRAVELAPARPEYRLELARAYRLGGNSAVAYEELQRVIATAPRLAEAHLVSGMLLVEHGRNQEAEVPLVRATELTPDDADAWYALGRCLAEIRQEPRAEEAYRRALGINPNFVGALLALGELLALGGRDAEAVALLTKAKAADPNDAEVLRSLGSVQSRMARTPEEARAAEAVLRDATTRAPDNAAVHFALGLHHLRHGRRDAAALEFRAAAALNPVDTRVLFALGSALRLAGRTEEARKVLAEFQRRNDYERQSRYLSMRIGRMPENADLYFRLADLHASIGAVNRARFEYQRGLRLRPNDAAARRKLEVLTNRKSGAR